MAKLLTPEEYAASGTEHAHQVALFMWAALAGMKCPLLRKMFAIPNGGERNVIVATNLKAEGVKPGVPDIMLPVARHGFHGLYIEMKREKGGNSRVSPDQHQWHIALKEEGYCVEVCWGWLEARRIICEYLKIDTNGNPVS